MTADCVSNSMMNATGSPDDVDNADEIALRFLVDEREHSARLERLLDAHLQSLRLEADGNSGQAAADDVAATSLTARMEFSPNI